MDQNFVNRSRDYSRCAITFRNENCTDVQRGCLCVAKSPFAPEPLQDSANGDYVILSVRRLYGKLEDFTVGKWTVTVGCETKEPLVIDLGRSNIIHLFTCCTPSKHIYGKVCKCEASFSVLVLHKKFSDKLRVQVELKASNRQFVPLSIIDVANVQSFPITYKTAILKRKKLFTKAVSLEGYFALEDEGKSSMLGEKVKAYSECIRLSVSGGECSASGSAILDNNLSLVCGIHNVQRTTGSTISLGGNYIAMGTSVFQMASQLISKQ